MAEGFVTDPKAHIVWCQRHFRSLADGGIWGVPRSGLVFQRQGEALVLIDRMPYTVELAEAAGRRTGTLPPSAEALLAFQDQDQALIAEHFREAGIKVFEGISK